MRNALPILAILSLAAPAAHAQTLAPIDGMNSIGTEAAVFLRPVSGQSVEALAMARLVEDALETSRELNRVDIPGDDVLQLEAPVAITRKTRPAKLAVTFEVRPVRGDDQTFSTACAADQLERCVASIIMQTERMARFDPAHR